MVPAVYHPVDHYTDRYVGKSVVLFTARGCSSGPICDEFRAVPRNDGGSGWFVVGAEFRHHRRLDEQSGARIAHPAPGVLSSVDANFHRIGNGDDRSEFLSIGGYHLCGDRRGAGVLPDCARAAGAFAPFPLVWRGGVRGPAACLYDPILLARIRSRLSA